MIRWAALHSVRWLVRNTPVAHSAQVNDTSMPRWAPGPAMHTAYHIAAAEFATVVRKGGNIPYLSHLLAVSSLVIENGGSEDQAAAALLHDVIEDRDIAPDTLVARLVEGGVSSESARFIVHIVEATSDGTQGQVRSPSTWRERKAAYHASLAAKQSTDPSLLVSLADKVHNIESTLVQVRAGEKLDEIYAHFNSKPAEQRWNYESLYGRFATHGKANPQLRRLVIRLEHALREVFTR